MAEMSSVRNVKWNVMRLGKCPLPILYTTSDKMRLVGKFPPWSPAQSVQTGQYTSLVCRLTTRCITKYNQNNIQHTYIWYEILSSNVHQGIISRVRLNLPTSIDWPSLSLLYWIQISCQQIVFLTVWLFRLLKVIFSSRIFVRNISVNEVWVAAEVRPDLRWESSVKIEKLSCDSQVVRYWHFSIFAELSLPHFASSGRKMGSDLISGFKGKSGKRHGREFHCSARLLHYILYIVQGGAKCGKVWLARRHGGMAVPCVGRIHLLTDKPHCLLCEPKINILSWVFSLSLSLFSPLCNNWKISEK